MAIECAFIGTLGHDPELKTSAAGKAWCRVSLAVGHNGDEVQWVSVAIFGESAQHVYATLRKQDKLYVEGALTLSRWTDRSGEQRTGLSVVATKAEPPEIGRHRSTKRARQDAAANDTAERSERPTMLSA